MNFPKLLALMAVLGLVSVSSVYACAGCGCSSKAKNTEVKATCTKCTGDRTQCKKETCSKAEAAAVCAKCKEAGKTACKCTSVQAKKCDCGETKKADCTCKAETSTQTKTCGAKKGGVTCKH